MFTAIAILALSQCPGGVCAMPQARYAPIYSTPFSVAPSPYAVYPQAPGCPGGCNNTCQYPGQCGHPGCTSGGAVTYAAPVYATPVYSAPVYHAVRAPRRFFRVRGLFGGCCGG